MRVLNDTAVAVVVLEDIFQLMYPLAQGIPFIFYHLPPQIYIIKAYEYEGREFFHLEKMGVHRPDKEKVIWKIPDGIAIHVVKAFPGYDIGQLEKAMLVRLHRAVA
jgi:hypothetical protein